MSDDRDLTLFGYRPSVYSRVIRLVLIEKRLAYDEVEVDPFGSDVSEDFRKLHPFGRVPVLRHGGFTLHETAAITRYLDAAFPEVPLSPAGAEALGRMAQVIGIVDAYAYWPLVRQVFAHGVFRGHEGLRGDPDQIAAGLESARVVLAALDRICEEGLVLNGRDISLADCHLAPMVAAFLAYPASSGAMASAPALSRWWRWFASRPSLRRTDIGFDPPRARDT